MKLWSGDVAGDGGFFEGWDLGFDVVRTRSAIGCKEASRPEALKFD